MVVSIEGGFNFWKRNSLLVPNRYGKWDGNCCNAVYRRAVHSSHLSLFWIKSCHILLFRMLLLYFQVLFEVSNFNSHNYIVEKAVSSRSLSEDFCSRTEYLDKGPLKTQSSLNERSLTIGVWHMLEVRLSITKPAQCELNVMYSYIKTTLFPDTFCPEYVL